MKNIAFVFWAISFLFTLSVQAQSLLGETIELPFSAEYNLTVSPNGDYLALVSRFDCQLFVVDEENARWLGPFPSPIGGFLGTRENPDRDSWDRRRQNLPLYGWTLMNDGHEALVLNPLKQRAVIFSDGSVLEVITALETDWQLLDTRTGRFRKSALDIPADFMKTVQTAYIKAKPPVQAAKGFVTTDPVEKLNIPDAPSHITDFSPQHDRVLCLPTEDEPLVSLNLRTGERVAFPIHERDRALPRDMSGSFSPDGEYVLMQYSYGPDDHYAGGYLQLFTKDGVFVEEVAEFDKESGAPVGWHTWLHNNWIVYSTGKKVVFRKFIGQ